MKKLLIILITFLTAGMCYGQDIKPTDAVNFKYIQSPFFFYNRADSSVWVNKGPADGWTRLASARMLKHTIDSLAATGFTRLYMDSVFLAKQDTLTVVATKTDLLRAMETQTDSSSSSASDSLKIYSYDYEIVSAQDTTITLPFRLLDKTRIFYNGSTLRKSNWKGMGTNIFTLNISPEPSDYVSILSIGKRLPPSDLLLWLLDSHGNITTNSDGLTDSFWIIDAYGNITPISTGTDNEFWKSDQFGNLTPA